jgi:hypothetical protein
MPRGGGAVGKLDAIKARRRQATATSREASFCSLGVSLLVRVESPGRWVPASQLKVA